MKTILIILSLSAGLFYHNMNQADKAARLELKISEEKKYTIFETLCTNLTSDSLTLTYELEIHKSGSSGTSTNSQSGQVSLLANEKKICSISRLNLNTGDSCTIELSLYQDKSLIDEEIKNFVAK